MPSLPTVLPFAANTVALTTTAIVLFGPDVAVPALPLYSNTHTVTFYNLDTANTVYLQAFDSVQGVLPTLTLSLSLVVPPQSAVTMNWGPTGRRSDPYLTGWTLYAATAAGTANLNVNCVNGAGSLLS